MQEPQPDQLAAAPRSERTETQTLTVAGHEFQLFVQAGPLIASMVQDIRRAESRVWLESYIFADDAAGKAILQALIDKARAGLDVRLMYDAVGSLNTPDAFFEPLTAAGGHVHVYHTLWEALRHFALLHIFNRRNHRKLLVIDEEIAYFGGMNIVDQRPGETVEEHKERDVPISGGWRDLHVRMKGPRQAELASIMQWLWRKEHRQKAPRRTFWRVRGLIGQKEGSFQFFDSYPLRLPMRVDRVFAELIRSAETTIFLSIAYFLPFGRVLRELRRARRRGVRIVVVVPGESDVKTVQHASRHLYEGLLKQGFEIYERQKEMLHSKVMVVDRKWTLVGSANLDARSLRLNLEVVCAIHSRLMAEAVQQICKTELEQSEQMTLEHCRKRNLWQRLIDYLAWMLRGWL